MRRSHRHASVLAPASTRHRFRVRARNRWDDAVGRIPALGVSDEGNDPFRRGSRDDFPGKRSSDLWHKLARSSVSLSGAVLPPGMARLWHCAGGRRLYCLEGRPAPSLVPRGYCRRRFGLFLGDDTSRFSSRSPAVLEGRVRAPALPAGRVRVRRLRSLRRRLPCAGAEPF
jgi:hypothetical protein